jgi:predicted dehydrogenase
MSEDVQVALVGCGRISQTHFDAINDVEGVRLVAVCDAIEKRARDAG